MRTKLATFALTGTLALTGVAGAALIAPAISYAATGDSTALDERVTSIREALAGLVTNGTLTQQQADEVASTLVERGLFDGSGHGGPGGHRGLGGHGLVEAAESLGITPEELRVAAEAGTTLGELAEQQGVSQDALVDALVGAQKAHLAEAVSDGRLTQAEADERIADAETRFTESLDEPVRIGSGHHGHRGDHGLRGEAPDTGNSQTPSQTPSASAESEDA